MNEAFLNGQTYKIYIRDLQRRHALNLSDKQYKKFKKQNVVFFYFKVNRILDRQSIRLQKVAQDITHLDGFTSRQSC